MNKNGIATIGTMLTLLLVMPFAGSAIISLSTANQIYETSKDVPKKDVALVLGAAAYPTRLSDILEDRVDTAVELYKAGKVDRLVMSGAPNEVEGMKGYAMSRKIPEEDITEDPNGLNTLASIRNSVKMNASIVIVTQRFHLPRALFIANTLGIDAKGLTADKAEYTKIFDFKSREILATSKTIFDIYFVRKVIDINK